MQQPSSAQTGGIQFALALYMFLSHLLIAGCALLLHSTLQLLGLDHLSLWLIILVAGGLLGLLLTSTIQYSLYLLGLALARFEQGLPIESLATATRWPLTALFQHLNTVNLRIKAYTQSAQLALTLREHALQQASESAAQAERNRIARELHDSIKQQIFSISISAAAAKAHWNGSSQDAQAAVEDIQQSAKEAQVEMQALLQQLRPAPLEHTSLAEALQIQAQALGFRTEARVITSIGELPGNDRLPPGTQETIFRIVQEAFANIARHARAHTVWINLQQSDDTIQIEIRDDGQGFDLQTVQKGMGLANVQERAHSLRGTIEIQSAPGQGTTIRVRVPLLETLHSAEEREQSALETARTIEQARRYLQLGENAAPIAMMLAIVQLIFTTNTNVLSLSIGIVACIVAAIYGYAQGHYAIARVILSLGNESSEARALREREHSLLLWLPRLALFSTWYIFFYFTQHDASMLFLTCIVSLFFIVLFALAYKKHAQTLDQQFALQTGQERHWELNQKKKNILRRFRIWLLVAAVLLLNGIRIYTTGGVPTPLMNGTLYGYACLIMGWGLTILFDHRQVRSWEHAPNTAKAENESASGAEMTSIR